MKRWIPCIFIILFPYAIAFLIYSLFHPSIMEHVFHDDIYRGVAYLFIFLLIAFISAIIVFIGNLRDKEDVAGVARMNMIIKLVQIPAYLYIFIFGLLCMVTIFTMGISFVLMWLDAVSISLSGLIGISAVKHARGIGALSGPQMILHGILQFIFCADIISSIIVFRKTKQRLSE